MFISKFFHLSMKIFQLPRAVLVADKVFARTKFLSIIPFSFQVNGLANNSDLTRDYGNTSHRSSKCRYTYAGGKIFVPRSDERKDIKIIIFLNFMKRYIYIYFES